MLFIINYNYVGGWSKFTKYCKGAIEKLKIPSDPGKTSLGTHYYYNYLIKKQQYAKAVFND